MQMPGPSAPEAEYRPRTSAEALCELCERPLLPASPHSSPGRLPDRTDQEDRRGRTGGRPGQVKETETRKDERGTTKRIETRGFEDDD